MIPERLQPAITDHLSRDSKSDGKLEPGSFHIGVEPLLFRKKTHALLFRERRPILVLRDPGVGSILTERR
jgi:hypothetical protein